MVIVLGVKWFYFLFICIDGLWCSNVCFCFFVFVGLDKRESLGNLNIV